MTTGIDTGLGFYRDVLALRGYRQEVLTSNIANANTPGFKAKDLDFKEALGAALGTTSSSSQQRSAAPALLVSNSRHIGSAQGAPRLAAASLKYQTDTQVTLDGNSVDLGKEKAVAAANALDYTAAATFTSQTLRMLQTAIGGANSAPSGGG